MDERAVACACHVFVSVARRVPCFDRAISSGGLLLTLRSLSAGAGVCDVSLSLSLYRALYKKGVKLQLARRAIGSAPECCKCAVEFNFNSTAKDFIRTIIIGVNPFLGRLVVLFCTVMGGKERKKNT